MHFSSHLRGVFLFGPAQLLCLAATRISFGYWKWGGSKKYTTLKNYEDTLECSGWGKTQSWVSHWRRHSANCLWRRDHEVHSCQLSGLTNAIVQFEAHGTHFVLLHDCFCYSVVEPHRAPLLFLFTPQLSQLFPRIRQRDAAMSLLCSSFNLSTLP